MAQLEAQVTAAVEDYAKAIYTLEERDGAASTNDLAALLDVKPGSVSGMLETDLMALIQAKYENTGASSELLGFVTPSIKNRIGFFSRYQANVSGQTPNVYVATGKLDGTTLIGATVDVYRSDWGTFRLMPVLTDFMPTAYTAFFLDNDHVRIRAGNMLEPMELPNLGGGAREVIQSIFSVIPGDPRAHCRIDGTA